jgi:hypothetical protein
MLTNLFEVKRLAHTRMLYFDLGNKTRLENIRTHVLKKKCHMIYGPKEKEQICNLQC